MRLNSITIHFFCPTLSQQTIFLLEEVYPSVLDPERAMCCMFCYRFLLSFSSQKPSQLPSLCCSLLFGVVRKCCRWLTKTSKLAQVLEEKGTGSTWIPLCPTSCKASLNNKGKKEKQLQQQQQLCTCITLFGTFRYCTTSARRPIASLVNNRFCIFILCAWLLFSSLPHWKCHFCITSLIYNSKRKTMLACGS